MSFLTPLFLRLTPWLPRRGPDTHFPIVLTQRRVYILPTRSGIAFAVVLCVMLIGAVNYDLSLGHALVFLLAGLGLVGILHTFRNLAELHCSPGRAEAVFAGETAYFQLLVKNPRTTPKRALTFSFGQHPAASLNLAAHEQASIAVAHPTLRRGRLRHGRGPPTELQGNRDRRVEIRAAEFLDARQVAFAHPLQVGFEDRLARRGFRLP